MLVVGVVGVCAGAGPRRDIYLRVFELHEMFLMVRF